MSVLFSQPLAGLLDRLFDQAERNDPPLLEKAGAAIARHDGAPRDSVASAELAQAFSGIAGTGAPVVYTGARAAGAMCR